MLLNLWQRQSKPGRPQQKYRFRVEELSPRLMLSGSGTGDPPLEEPPPQSPPPVETSPNTYNP